MSFNNTMKNSQIRANINDKFGPYTEQIRNDRDGDGPSVIERYAQLVNE